MPAGRLCGLVRAHWLVENRCHRHLDVAFGEDACAVRDRIAAANLALTRRLARDLLANVDPAGKYARAPMTHRQDRFAMDHGYRRRVLGYPEIAAT